MNIFRYLDWPMYKEARALNHQIEIITKRFPYEIKKKYGDQWNSASLSICLNIAEGAGRYSDADMCRHFDIALGSISEVVSCADNLKHNNHISSDEFNDIFNTATSIAKQLQGMKYDSYKNPRIIKKEFEYNRNAK